MVIRVRKQDSAYLYQLLESYEGLASYSTITERAHLEHPYRDIALHVAPDLREQLDAVLSSIAEEISIERRLEAVHAGDA